MTIRAIPPSQAARLMPLFHQVHDLHVAEQPDRYAPLPTDPETITWLSTWLSSETVHALGHETDGALTGYLIYEIETRPSTPMRRAETRAMLDVISVDAAHRSQGIGSGLIQAMRASLDPEAVPTIATTYATFNTPSAALMARAGFEPKVIVAEWRL